MPFIGNKPSAVPLTSADIADGIITSAKIVDATITNSDVASSIITGQTAETSIAGGDSVLIYDDSASALRKMTRTNFVSGIGGVNTPAFHATRETSGQSMANNTATEVIFNVEKFDTGSCYNTTNGRFTPTTAGKYFVYSQITWENLTLDTYVELQISKNGVNVFKFRDRNSATYGAFSASGFIELNGTTDYVSTFAYHEKGSSNNIYAETNGLACFFGAYRIIE